MAEQVHRGRCACGAVTYEVAGPLRPVSICHCDTCRRQAGHQLAATNAALAALTIQGEDNLAEWQATPDAVRRFCRNCGSPLFWQRVGGSTVAIMAGSLDRPTGLSVSHHIFVAEKGDYYEIADGLPQHAHWPPR
jgi:hypothetical protein